MKHPADTTDLLMEQRLRYQEELDELELYIEFLEQRAERLESKIEAMDRGIEEDG